MAFEFKKLSDVNVIEAMKDGLNVLVEDGGEIVKLAANSMIPEDVALKSDIPEDIALKSDIPDAIPVPMTAEVGQVVAVKAVDENGKPTEWEAVNVGGGGISYFYVENGYIYHYEQIGDYGGPGEKVTKEEFVEAVMKGPLYIGGIDANGTFVFTLPSQISCTEKYGCIFDNYDGQYCTAEYVNAGPS